MKDLIDLLGIYRARTLPKAPKQDGKALTAPDNHPGEPNE